MKRISNQTTDELISLFRIVATERREHMLDSSNIANRRYFQMKKIIREIKNRKQVDIKRFLELFHDPDPNIRLAAAGEALYELNELTAKPILKEIESADIKHLSFEAHWTLREWLEKNKK